MPNVIRRGPWPFATVMLAVILLLHLHTGKSNAQLILPNPVIELIGTRDTVGPPALRIYTMGVVNAQAFPDALFAPAPDLPPCGLNLNASRIWVEFHTITNGQTRYANGYCALSANEILQSLTFSARLDSLPDQVILELNDRLIPALYRSAPLNLSESPLFPIPSPLWKSRYNIPDADLGRDSDSDGFPAWVEGAFGTDPTSAQSTPALRVTGREILIPLTLPKGSSTLTLEYEW